MAGSQGMGRLAVAFIVIAGIAGGAGVWWFQTRAFYETARQIETVTLASNGAPVELAALGTSIDADSSPLRYRGCFALTGPAPEPLDPYEGAAPTIAPAWFECFDASAIGADLAAGRARAVLAQRDVEYGIDRVAALYPDGGGFLWHQINRCGAAVFGGDPLPEGCAEPPED